VEALRAWQKASAEREIPGEQAPVGVCRVDIEGRLVSVNRAAEVIFGRNAAVSASQSGPSRRTSATGGTASSASLTPRRDVLQFAGDANVNERERACLAGQLTGRLVTSSRE